MDFRYLTEMLPFGTWLTGFLCWAAFIMGNLIFTNRHATKMEALPFVEYLLYIVSVMLGIAFYNGVNQIYPNLWIAPVKFSQDCAPMVIGAMILTPILLLAHPFEGESKLNGSSGGRFILKIINVFVFFLLTGFFLTLGGRPQ